MTMYVVLVVYSLLALASSLAGGYLPMMMHLTHARAQMMMTFVAGLMLGVALFVMLPHAAMATDDLDTAIFWMTIGLLFMFFLLRTFHFHQHGPQATTPETDQIDGCGHDHDHDHDHDHGHAHSHDHSHDHSHGHSHGSGGHRWSWAGVGFGLALHTLLDGVALGASVRADFGHSHTILPGFATLLAIVLHKPLDAMAISTLMAAGGWKSGPRQLVNGLFGLMCPLGVALFLFSLGRFASHENLIIGCVLAFSAGLFLCISLGDLLPEIQFHSHDRIKLSLLLVLGVTAAYLTALLDRQSHSHSHSHSAVHGVESDSPGHSHEHDHKHGESGHSH